MSQRYAIWSRISKHHAWIEVAQDLTKKEAEEGVARRQRVAEKNNMDPEGFVALPAGQVPSAE